MTAARLREAAALMRERAEAASPSPWAHETGNPGVHHIVADDGTFVCDLEDGYVDNGLVGQDVPADDDARHISSWHPAVALAVADWLDACALVCEVKPAAAKANALAVADAYLGQP